MSLRQMEAQKNLRTDSAELKAQLFKKVGQDRFKKYFHCLNRFINQKLSKSEFDKSCYRILGRENLPLHNQIIRAVLKNACSAKTPPQAYEAGPTNKVDTVAGRNPPALEDGHQSSVAPIWSNGVGPISPRKGKSTIRDRKLRDRPSPLGPSGKTDINSHQSTTTGIGAKFLENGDLGHLAPCDYQRPLHQLQGFAEQPENNERLIIKKSADNSRVFHGNDQNNAAAIGDGEEVEHASHLKSYSNPLIAPLGIPFCSASTGGARKVLPMTHVGDSVSCFDLGGLSDSVMLRRRMEHIASVQDLGVTLECANTLNTMVDVYVKRLISSCLALVGSRSEHDPSTCPVVKQQMRREPVNGIWPSNPSHMQNSAGAIPSVSLLDFKVAMELNPQQLGENWPLLLEKISMHGFEE